ncbi:MAG: asparagine synthase-related protein [Sedimenticola sp.]
MSTLMLKSGLTGWYSFTNKNGYFLTPTLFEQFKKGLHTSLKLKETLTSSDACASTDDCCQFNSTGLSAVIGSPIWSDSEINTIAKKSGNAFSLATAYKKFGLDFINHISGSFGFVIIDRENDVCLIGTDRLSRNPIYYTKTVNGIAFSSTPDALIDLHEQRSKLYGQGIYNYVYFHMIPSPTSIYEGVSKVPAGHLVQINRNVTNTVHYWKPKFQVIRNTSFEDLKKEFKCILKESVSRSVKNSDKTGAFLSGGLDSSTVVGMLSEVSEKNIDAFSIGFSADGYDEMAYARITAEHFGVKLHEYYVTPEDVVNALPIIATNYDEPFGNSSALPSYFCAKFAKENGIERLIAGDGGDELFAGNVRYSKQKIFEAYTRIPEILREYFLEPTLKLLPDGLPLIGKAKSYINQANIPLPDRLETYNFLHRHNPVDIFTPEFLADINCDTPLDYQRFIYNAPENASTLNRMLYLDWHFTLADNDLRKVSHACSLAGVEVSYPMLDDQLIEFSCKLPDKLKLKGRTLRYFFKESLKGWLPDETIHKKKHGFGLPFGIWVKTHKPLQTLAYDCLSNLSKRRIFKPQFIDQVIELHKNVHAAYYGELVWVLTILELWLAEHDENAYRQ